MACSVSFYPSTSSSLRSYRRYESSLILSRVKETRELEKNEKDENNETNRHQGLTALDFRLRRDERKRRLQRTQSYRSSTVQETPEDTPPHPVEKKEVVVTDRLGNDIYVLGETNEDRIARELDQWVRKMKTVGTLNTGLEAFKDIKVGVYQSDVLHGSPSYEPYPSLKDKTFTYTGGKDSKVGETT
ncbi:uncharacterized protein LOC111717797 [Eurytemora carolleeae]|uniref:uncharacterized protein LOC111717797 n=1 Tax=Eurytemora carolleeae TaxID=1294199 RepID=UPI000C79552D|nr:uncharacterized protein LOC111717797 [Eurytemora carolleeae]|eukprot:XP_023349011.1 uncharacterized protein LOC111717797 [Eurytemora affinis]